ncbi:MAG: thiamine-monophosphate kinase [bacterium]|nr:MAG: thiamine-monophosphate kinase [bacterium]
MEIKEVGELGLIERIKTKLAFPHQDIIKGIGDDACAIEIQKGRLLLSTSDALIEDVHFDLRFISAYKLILVMVLSLTLGISVNRAK